VTTDFEFSGNGGDSLGLNISALENVSGDLRVHANRGLERLAAPALTTVSGNLSVHSHEYPGLNDLSAPALVTVGGSLEVYDEPNLAAIKFRGLTTVVGGFEVRNVFGASALPARLRVEAPALANVGGFFKFTFTAASELPLPSLVDVGTFEVSSNGLLTSIVVPVLQNVDNSLWIRGNSVLAAFASPALQTAQLVSITSNGELLSAQLGYLRNGASPLTVSVVDNSKLALIQCGATALDSLTVMSNATDPNLALVLSFPFLVTVSNDLSLGPNPGVRNFNQLDRTERGSLQSVGGNVTIDAAGSLAAKSAADALVQQIRIGGTTRVTL
jgi:hypothetical protein